jgi:hypothetical protein
MIVRGCTDWPTPQLPARRADGPDRTPDLVREIGREGRSAAEGAGSACGAFPQKSWEAREWQTRLERRS